MFAVVKSRRNKRVGLAAIAALVIGAVTLPSAPAQAQLYVGVGVPYYAPGYYYPYYYPRRAAYRACGWGWHWAPPHLTRWGRWVSGGCRPNW
ncbi:MAG: hypothetical protein JO162_15160 [Alphaproteobacteria bacterium]|nr:hypothetical protein [Alphaproteobacteria bacterium]MBV9016821.1 hypothetical protein [Alphaproteobacteria bacterium]MBV9150577.1 hypothetical protein [Alphaproteobacteria bacterium]